MRVTLATGGRVTIENPTVRNDSIVGVTGADVGVASRDVRSLEVRRFSVGNTVGLVLGTAVVVGGVGFLILLSSLNFGS